MLSTNPIAKLGKSKYYFSLFDLEREREVNSFLERRKGPRKKITNDFIRGNYVCLATSRTKPIHVCKSK